MSDLNFFSNNNSEQNKNKSNSPFLLNIKNENFVLQKIPEKKIQTKTINDFDSSLILEKINKTVTNKAVKLGMKISTLKRELDMINEKIELLKLLNLDADKKKLSALIQVKENIEGSLIKLEDEQKRKGLFYYLYSFFDEKFNISKFVDFIKSIVTPYFKQLKKCLLNFLIKLFDYVKTNINKQQL